MAGLPEQRESDVGVHEGRAAGKGHAAAGEAVLLQHALQHLHVGGDIHGVVLEELVKLLLEALHHLVHHALDAGLSRADILSLHALLLHTGVGPEDFEGRRQIVA